MPYAYGEYCYATTGEALGAFQKQFPLLGDVNWTTHVSSSVNASGLVSYSVNTRPITSNTVASRTGTFQLPSCSTPDAPKFDAVSAGGIFVFFFSSVVMLWFAAKNMGLILDAVRRW